MNGPSSEERTDRAGDEMAMRGVRIPSHITNGRFMQIAYEPKSNTAACFAKAISLFRVPSPPALGQESFPIVMDMTIKP